jgi:arylformamidase
MTPPVFGSYDQAGLDAQYNLRARHPDHPEYFERWARESALVRASLPCHLDLAYGDRPKETLDLFPADRPSAPILAFLHGGYWQALDKSDFSYLAPVYVERGVTFVSVNYELAPDVSIETILAQCRRALLWLWRNAYELGADRDRIFVAGHSAGGHLATMSLITDWTAAGALPADLVKGACSVSGVYDLEPIRVSYQNPILKLDRVAAVRLSPIRNVPATAGPLLLAVGAEETDEFLRQQKEFAAAWVSRGLACETVPLPGRHHFSAVDALGEPGSPLTERVIRMATSGTGRQLPRLAEMPRLA